MNQAISYLITGAIFLAIVGIMMLIVLIRGYKGCFSKDNKLKHEARNKNPEWKILLSGIVISFFGVWIIATFWLAN